MQNVLAQVILKLTHTIMIIQGSALQAQQQEETCHHALQES